MLFSVKRIDNDSGILPAGSFVWRFLRDAEDFSTQNKDSEVCGTDISFEKDTFTPMFEEEKKRISKVDGKIVPLREVPCVACSGYGLVYGMSVGYGNVCCSSCSGTGKMIVPVS
jgi:RecJ-like exonuclease